MLILTEFYQINKVQVLQLLILSFFHMVGIGSNFFLGDKYRDVISLELITWKNCHVLFSDLCHIVE